MGIGEVALGGVTAVATGLGFMENERSRRDRKRENRRAYKFEKEKWREYKKDLTSRRRATETEREERLALARRKFDAAMGDYDIRSKAIEEMIQEQKDIRFDPTRAPVWRSFRDKVMEQARSTIKGLSGQMERAGRTGGAQDRMRQDVSEALLSKLGTEMLGIQEGARMRQLELEGTRPATPFLEYFGDPELSINLSQYQGIYSPEGHEVWSPDLTGFGMAAASLLNRRRRESPTGAPVATSVAPPTGVLSGWEQYSRSGGDFYF